MIPIALAAAVAAGLQSPAPAPALDPTPIEHALVDHVCRGTRRFQPGTEAYRICYEEQLPALREDFGRDLGRLSSADRRAMDAACGRMQEAEGREAYLSCLTAQLTAVRNRRARGKPAAPPPPPPVDSAPPAEVLPPDAAPTPAVDAAPPPQSSAIAWLAGALAAAAVAGAGLFLALKRRKPAVKCRSCGADVQGAGDLCAACRHEAAESRRRAAAERAEEARSEETAVRRLAQEQQELERREQMRRDEEARLRAADEARRREELERRQRDDEARRQREATSGDAFDPHAVLGVPPDATSDAIRAAYERAKAKYAPSEYEHFGAELQDHLKAKAQAVERAYQMLTTER